jgi:hypothetical protein
MNPSTTRVELCIHIVRNKIQGNTIALSDSSNKKEREYISGYKSSVPAVDFTYIQPSQREYARQDKRKQKKDTKNRKNSSQAQSNPKDNKQGRRVTPWQ